jgi:signal transduction histidine kinase
MIDLYPAHQRTLEINILLRFVRSTILIILLYLTFDLYKSSYDAALKAAVSVVVYGSCYGLIIYTRGSYGSTVFVMCIFILSIIGGFFFQGGIFGINSLYMFGLIIVLLTIFSGRDRNAFIAIYFFVLSMMAYVQLCHSEWIIDDGKDDTVLMNIFEIMACIGNTVYINYLYKCEFEKERVRVFDAHEQLEQTSIEISTQNEAIATYNKRLEVLVEERMKDIQILNRKLIEYAFFNSHKVRGPLARILGLIYLMKRITVSSQDNYDHELVEHINMMDVCATELDDVIKTITKLLDEETKDLLETNTSISSKEDYYTLITALIVKKDDLYTGKSRTDKV